MKLNHVFELFIVELLILTTGVIGTPMVLPSAQHSFIDAPSNFEEMAGQNFNENMIRSVDFKSDQFEQPMTENMVGMKFILLLGSGRVTGPFVDYFLRQPDIFITIGNTDLLTRRMKF